MRMADKGKKDMELGIKIAWQGKLLKKDCLFNQVQNNGQMRTRERDS